MNIEYNKKLDILIDQEEKFKFDSFNNDDAWKLGCFLVGKVKEKGIDLAICIRKPDGNIVFQYVTEGTDLENEMWMRRKFNSVMKTGKSSLRAAVECLISGENIFDENSIGCGGGFPIKISGTNEIKMVLTVSNLPHVEDHDFIASCLEKYLGKTIEHITEDIPIVEP